MRNFVQFRILPLVLGSAAAVLASNAPASALTWNFTASNNSSTNGTGSFTYSGSGDGTFNVTSLNYTETSPNSGGIYVLDTNPASGNEGTTNPGIDQVLVSGGLITQYNLYAVDSTASNYDYGRSFVSNIFGFGGVFAVEYDSSGNSSATAATITFTPVVSSAVPFDIPGGATIPALGSVLALGVMRKAKKSTSNKLSNTATEKVN